MPWEIRQNHGIHLPQIGWWLDATKAQPRGFVSHAHSDHLGPVREIVATRATAGLMNLRQPGRRTEQVLRFGEPWAADFGCEFTLHPAGHVFGSAMLHIAAEPGTLLYTGDYKLRTSLAAEPCQPVRADTLIMETTFGLPRYVFPPEGQVEADIVAFCRTALADGVTPVLHAYSLGKTQELLQLVGQAGLPVMLHAHGHRVSERYAALGMKLPPFALLDVKHYAGHVVIAPPGGGATEPISWIHPRRTAVVTGWALDSATRYRSGCDAAFPLSDHADFPDLLRLVDLVQPKVVYTVHGFAREFAATLRARGVEAWALGQGNQMELSL